MATKKTTTTKKAPKPTTPKAKAPKAKTPKASATKVEAPQREAKKPRAKKAAAEKADKKLSQIEAAIKVLAEAKEPMNCTAMVEAMQAKGYWTSPGGKTPAQTLYSSILRDLRKGKDARFVKADRGLFGLNK